MRRVLVTRPRPGADATAARLAAKGFLPVLLPLTRIAATAPARLPDASVVDAVAATSVNAFRHAPAALVAAVAEKPLFAVGDSTAAAAREAGFREVRSASGTALELAALIGGATRPGGRVLHLAGTVRTAGFDQDLRERGLEVETLELYRAEPVDHPDEDVARMLAGGPIWAAPVFSTRGGELLAMLARRDSARQELENTRFFCISEKAASPLRQLAGERVSVSGQPTEDGVLALLWS